MKKRELLIVIFIVVTMIISYFYRKNESVEVVVYYHQEKLDIISLNKDHTYTYKGDQGTFHLEVKNKRYRAIDVDCPNQICVNTGWLNQDSEESIICVPNGLSVVKEKT